MNKTIQLNDSGVLFNREEHTYELNGKFLSGITEMLQRQLFPDEFDGVPEEAIQQAARYGTEVHESIEQFDSFWTNDGTQEVADYIDICTTNGLIHERSEYTVTDGMNWASNIDKVFRKSDAVFDIADVKTYGTMTPEKQEKARWQLSIYAYLFETLNPNATVGKLYIIHLRNQLSIYAYLFETLNPNATVGKLYIIHLRNKLKKDGTTDHIANLIEVDRIPSEVCKKLLDTDLAGEIFENPYDIPADIAEQEDEIRHLIQTKKEVEERLNELKSEILSRMEETQARSWNTETMKLTRKLPSTRYSFDLNRFKSNHPEFNYDDYMKKSTVGSSLLITV